jgi:hypothetical protein
LGGAGTACTYPKGMVSYGAAKSAAAPMAEPGRISMPPGRDEWPVGYGRCRVGYARDVASSMVTREAESIYSV